MQALEIHADVAAAGFVRERPGLTIKPSIGPGVISGELLKMGFEHGRASSLGSGPGGGQTQDPRSAIPVLGGFFDGVGQQLIDGAAQHPVFLGVQLLQDFPLAAARDIKPLIIVFAALAGGAESGAAPV